MPFPIITWDIILLHCIQVCMLELYTQVSGIAKVGNGWAQAQPIMSGAQPILMFIAQSIYLFP